MNNCSFNCANSLEHYTFDLYGYVPRRLTYKLIYSFFFPVSEALPVTKTMSIQLAKTATSPSPSLITEWLTSSPSDSSVSQPARSTAQQATQSQLSLSSVDQLVVTSSTVPSPSPSPSSPSRVLQSDIFTSLTKPASASPSPSPSLSVHPPDFTSLATLSANPSPPLRVGQSISIIFSPSAGGNPSSSFSRSSPMFTSFSPSVSQKYEGRVFHH